MSSELDIFRQLRQLLRDNAVSILRFHPSDGQGKLRGFADLYIGDWHFRVLGCRAYANHDSRWIALPAYPFYRRRVGLVSLSASLTYRSRGRPLADCHGAPLLRRFSDAACAALDVYQPGWSDPR